MRVNAKKLYFCKLIYGLPIAHADWACFLALLSCFNAFSPVNKIAKNRYKPQDLVDLKRVKLIVVIVICPCCPKF